MNSQHSPTGTGNTHHSNCNSTSNQSHGFPSDICLQLLWIRASTCQCIYSRISTPVPACKSALQQWHHNSTLHATSASIQTCALLQASESDSGTGQGMQDMCRQASSPQCMAACKHLSAIMGMHDEYAILWCTVGLSNAWSHTRLWSQPHQAVAPGWALGLSMGCISRGDADSILVGWGKKPSVIATSIHPASLRKSAHSSQGVHMFGCCAHWQIVL